MNVATLRLNLTDDGWYIGADESETVEDTQAAVNAPVPRRTPEQTSPVLVVALVRNNDYTGQDAAQSAEAICSIVGSLLGPGDRRINVLDPRLGRNG